ncbi:MAG TPA: zf-HC2 domain-containing protein [Acidimicrobiia bacterium]|nr:zf-HC2 domain-containing protein [Acidimicrobiia bacterium]HZQ76315.1 zf-HC2 domain-containing protein [Acidimicrobiia bacterium]
MIPSGPTGPPGEHLGDALSAFLDDELAPAARREAETHLAGCSDCRAELEEVAAARRAIRIMPVHATRRALWGEDPGGAVPGPSGGPGEGWPGLTSRRPAAARRRRAAWALAAAVAAAIALLLPRDPSVAPSLPSLADTHAARASVTGDPLSQLAPIAVPVSFGP